MPNQPRLIDVSNLIGVPHWAKKMGVDQSYPRQLIKRGLLEVIIIDKKQFVDLSKYPRLPTNKSKPVKAKEEPEQKYDEAGNPI